ncbi:MAG: hypothetical protein EZS28_040248 [Streblomastix strix]|uniref:Uncharacterized protein n=1 Tax=Streblomastix strix TaxID=222440 RepID=A0A5J4U3K2_9EUKA|nr:MAG: hypothetical protein EZS28_040248 [Streblomastix strix]
MEQFIDTVDSARTGFNRERTVNQRDDTGDIEMFVNKIYESQHHQAFKIQFNFGVIYEEYRHDQNDQVQVDYGYILPRDTRIQEHSPKVIQNQDDIDEYQQYIKAEIINMQNFTLESTRQRYIAIYSMLIKTYNLQPQVVGASMKELIDFHCGVKRMLYIRILEIITTVIWKQQQKHYILIYVSPLKALKRNVIIKMKLLALASNYLFKCQSYHSIPRVEK